MTCKVNGSCSAGKTPAKEASVSSPVESRDSSSSSNPSTSSSPAMCCCGGITVELAVQLLGILYFTDFVCDLHRGFTSATASLDNVFHAQPFISAACGLAGLLAIAGIQANSRQSWLMLLPLTAQIIFEIGMLAASTMGLFAEGGESSEEKSLRYSKVVIAVLLYKLWTLSVVFSAISSKRKCEELVYTPLNDISVCKKCIVDI